MTSFTFNDEDEFEVLTLCLDGEEEEDCLILGIFKTRVFPHEYIALMPVRLLESEEEECTLYLYRYSESMNGEINLEQIEDDDELLIVEATFEDMYGDDE